MKTLKKIFAAMIAVCLVLCMTSCDISGIISDITGGDAVAIEGEYVEVDDKMMGFFLNDYIINWYNNYGIYLSMFSVDLTKDLRDQTFGECAYETYFLGAYDGTWYDYFLDSVKEQVEGYVVYADAAVECGITLTDDQLIEIETIIAGLNERMTESGANYTDWYGEGVDENAVRRCYELMFLASNFSDYFRDKLENELSDSEAIEYRENNKQDFYSADCYVFEIELVSEDLSDEEFDNRLGKIHNAVNAMTSAESLEEFLALVENYGTNIGLGNFGLELEAINFSKEEGIINDWLFGNSLAEKNECKSIETSETYKGGTNVYEKHRFEVYFVVEPMHYDTEPTHNFAYLVSNNRNDVYRLIETFAYISAPSLDSFLNMCEFVRLENYGEGYEFGDGEMFAYDKAEEAYTEFFSPSFDVINDWIESPDRADREVSNIIEIKVENASNKGSIDKYYAVIYFYSHGEPAWAVEAFSGAQIVAHDEWYIEQLLENPIKYNTSVLSRLDAVKLSDGKSVEDNFFSNILSWLGFEDVINWISSMIFGETTTETESTDNDNADNIGSKPGSFDTSIGEGLGSGVVIDGVNGSFSTVIGGDSIGNIVIGGSNEYFDVIGGSDAVIVVKPGVSIGGGFQVIIGGADAEDDLLNFEKIEAEEFVIYPAIPGEK